MFDIKTAILIQVAECIGSGVFGGMTGDYLLVMASNILSSTFVSLLSSCGSSS